MRNILFCGNYKVFDGILSCIISILEKTRSNEPFCFYIYTMDVSNIKPDYTPITDVQIEFLREVILNYNKNNSIIKIDVTNIYNREFAKSPNEQAYCSPYTLIRLFVDIVPNMPNKVLYLDIDILFNREIELLYDIDINDYEYAASRDHYGKFLINRNYINAGVILFNMTKIKQTKLLQKARLLIKTKKLLFADQDAIYKSTLCKLMLPQKYNDQKFLNKKTIARHFSKRLFWLPYPHIANIKQWDVTKMHKIYKYYEFDSILYKYLYLKYKFNEQIKGLANEK